VALQAICASSLGISNPDIDFSYLLNMMLFSVIG
jgi:hypothetical protein